MISAIKPVKYCSKNSTKICSKTNNKTIKEGEA